MRRGGSYRGKQISTGCAGACLRDGWQAADATVTGGGVSAQPTKAWCRGTAWRLAMLAGEEREQGR